MIGSLIAIIIVINKVIIFISFTFKQNTFFGKLNTSLARVDNKCTDRDLPRGKRKLLGSR